MSDEAKGEGASQQIKGKEIGAVTHYFPHVNVCVVNITNGKLQIGDKIRIVGHTTDLTEDVTSLEVDHKPVKEAKKKHQVGLLVKDRVREHDKVYKL